MASGRPVACPSSSGRLSASSTAAIPGSNERHQPAARVEVVAPSPTDAAGGLVWKVSLHRFSPARGIVGFALRATFGLALTCRYGRARTGAGARAARGRCRTVRSSPSRRSSSSGCTPGWFGIAIVASCSLLPGDGRRHPRAAPCRDPRAIGVALCGWSASSPAGASASCRTCSPRPGLGTTASIVGAIVERHPGSAKASAGRSCSACSTHAEPRGSVGHGHHGGRSGLLAFLAVGLPSD